METLLDKKLIGILEYRIQQEEYSARLYRDMANWFEDQGFVNLAAIYYKYGKEERVHMKWAEEFLLDYGIKPTLKILPTPEFDYNDVKHILTLTLEHELKITDQCKELTKAALAQDNYVLYALGLKYLVEQQEELGKSRSFLDIYGHSDNDLFFDHYIGEYYND